MTVSPEVLNQQVDRLLQMGNVPNIAQQCDQLEADTALSLNDTQAAIRDGLTTQQQVIRNHVQRLFHKQKAFYDRIEQWTRRTGLLAQDFEATQGHLRARAEQLQHVVEQHQAQLERNQATRSVRLRDECVQILDAARRQIAFLDSNAQQQQQHAQHPQQPPQQHAAFW